MADDSKTHRLQTVELDEESLAAASRDQEQERQIAIFDLLEENSFHPEGAAGGPYDLKMGLIENRLVLDVRGPGYERRHILSLSPFRGLIKDYFMICESYYQAIRSSTPSQMIRRRRIVGVSGLATTKLAPASRPRNTCEGLVWPVTRITGAKLLGSSSARRSQLMKS